MFLKDCEECFKPSTLSIVFFHNFVCSDITYCIMYLNSSEPFEVNSTTTLSFYFHVYFIFRSFKLLLSLVILLTSLLMT